MNWNKVLRFFLASIPLSVIYYFLLANVIYIGDDARLLNENRSRARELDTLEERLSLLDGSVKSLQGRDAGIYRAIFGSSPAEDLYNEELGQNIGLESALEDASRVVVSLDSIKSNLKYLGGSAANIPSVIPVEGCGKDAVGASLGRKVNPLIKSVVWHTGVDIAAERGTPVVSSADGVVSLVTSDRAEGEVVEVDHLNGYVTRYTHLENITVHKGDSLARGTRMASVGMSGKTIAPHLHYEILMDGHRVNPVCYFFSSLKPDEYSYAMHKAENTGQSLD